MEDSYDSSVPLDARYRSVSPLANATYESAQPGDLSLSDLSTNNEIPGPSRQMPFSLLARPLRPPQTPQNPQEEVEDVGNETARPVEEEGEENEETRAQFAAQSREERLRQDLFVLRKINTGLAVYNEALSGTRTSTERVAEQLKQTNALLDKYVDILAKSEAATKLIFDERWHGAEDDEATLQQLHHEAAEKARKAAEERARFEQEQKERKEREERERKDKEERERLEAEKREKLAVRAGYGGVRGVRGNRATARARGAAVSRIGGSTGQRGRTSSIPTNTTTTGSGGRIPRPVSTSSATSTKVPATTSSRSGVR
ncbi:hypothetical protein ACEPAI_7570 [Sanghuangporus weigelae]